MFRAAWNVQQTMEGSAFLHYKVLTDFLENTNTEILQPHKNSDLDFWKRREKNWIRIPKIAGHDAQASTPAIARHTQLLCNENQSERDLRAENQSDSSVASTW